MQYDRLIHWINIWKHSFKQSHDGLEVVFWTQVQRSGVQIPLIPRFFYFSYELWGSWVQIPIEFALFFPTWNYYSFVIYHFCMSWIMHICLQKSLSNYLTFRSFFDQCEHPIRIKSGKEILLYSDFHKVCVVNWNFTITLWSNAKNNVF